MIPPAGAAILFWRRYPRPHRGVVDFPAWQRNLAVKEGRAREDSMSIFRSPKPSTSRTVVNPNIESDIRGEMERAPPRHSGDNESGITAEAIADGIDRIAGEPLAQISRTITELT